MRKFGVFAKTTPYALLCSLVANDQVSVATAVIDELPPLSDDQLVRLYGGAADEGFRKELLKRGGGVLCRRLFEGAKGRGENAGPVLEEWRKQVGEQTGEAGDGLLVWGERVVDVMGGGGVAFPVSVETLVERAVASTENSQASVVTAKLHSLRDVFCSYAESGREFELLEGPAGPLEWQQALIDCCVSRGGVHSACLVKGSSLREPKSSRLLDEVGMLITTVLDSIDAHMSMQHVDEMWTLFEFLPQRNDTDDERICALQDRVDVTEKKLIALEVVWKYAKERGGGQLVVFPNSDTNQGAVVGVLVDSFNSLQDTVCDAFLDDVDTLVSVYFTSFTREDLGRLIIPCLIKRSDEEAVGVVRRFVSRDEAMALLVREELALCDDADHVMRWCEMLRNDDIVMDLDTVEKGVMVVSRARELGLRDTSVVKSLIGGGGGGEGERHTHIHICEQRKPLYRASGSRALRAKRVVENAL